MKINQFIVRFAGMMIGGFVHYVANCQTSLFVSGSSSVYVKSATLTASNGHITNNGTINGTTAGILNMKGTSSQNINGTATNTTTIGRININNTSGVSLGTNVDVTAATGLDFSTGPLTLNNSMIRFSVGSSWTGNDGTTKFFITNGLGLVAAYNNGSAIQYPVGIATGATNYTPITITNAGTADIYAVRAQAGFYTSYSHVNGAPTGSLVNSNVVNTTWVVNEGTLGGSVLTIQVQWNAANETSGFNRLFSMVGYYQHATTNWLVSSIGGVLNNSAPYSKSVAPGITTFHYMPITIGNSASPLPVELLNFRAAALNADAHITWTTASEINNDRFEIERSMDEVSFERIGTQKGAGNSTHLIHYELIDAGIGNAMSQGTVYYRLKQIDFDGAYTYSSIQSVLFDKVAAVVIYPNPTKGNSIIHFTAIEQEDILIRVIDVLGAIVKEEKVSVTKGDQEILLDLNELANGSYELIMISSSSVSSQKIMISK